MRAAFPENHQHGSKNCFSKTRQGRQVMPGNMMPNRYQANPSFVPHSGTRNDQHFVGIHQVDKNAHEDKYSDLEI